MIGESQVRCTLYRNLKLLGSCGYACGRFSGGFSAVLFLAGIENNLLYLSQGHNLDLGEICAGRFLML
jgi:hypothetical protein